MSDSDSPEAEQHEGEAAGRRDAPAEELTPEERRFIEGLLERGEAAEAVDGELPDDATHEVVGPNVERRRFTLD